MSEKLQKHAGCITIAQTPPDKAPNTRGGDYNQKAWLVYLIRLNLYDDIIQLLQHTGLGPDLMDQNEMPKYVHYEELRTIITSLPNHIQKIQEQAMTVDEKKNLFKKGNDITTIWYSTVHKNCGTRGIFSAMATMETIKNPVSVFLYGYLNYMNHAMEAEADDDEPDSFEVPNPFAEYLYYTPMQNDVLNKRNLVKLGIKHPEDTTQPNNEKRMKSFNQLKIADRHPKWMYNLVTIGTHIFKPLSQDANQPQPSFGEKGFVFDCAKLDEYFPQEDRTKYTSEGKTKITMKERLQKATEQIEGMEQILKAMKTSIAETPNIAANETITKLEECLTKLKNVTDITKKEKENKN